MPLVIFQKEIVDDAALVPTLPVEALQEFCTMALTNLREGTVGPKIYNRLAEAVSSDADTVRKAIESLSQIYVECAKRYAPLYSHAHTHTIQ